MQLKVWTAKPSDLLREGVSQHSLSRQDADALVKHSRFNGLFVVFFRLCEAHYRALEGIAAHLGLQSEQCQVTRLFDTRWYPSGDPRERGIHDAEIDLWHFKRIDYPRTYHFFDDQDTWEVQEHSPDEAIQNRVLLIREVVDEINEIPLHDQTQDTQKMLAHHEGYLERVRQEFPDL